jgi:sterol desaturase/sphingolipid hydroxylase (fatty acid hydroxylase superfamily)
MLNTIAAWIQETLALPALHALGLMAFSEQAHQFIVLALYGCMFMLALAIVVTPLERWKPVETDRNAAAVRNDMGYTALAQLGLLPLIPAAALVLVFDPLDAWLRSFGFVPFSLEESLPLLRDSPLVAFLLYLIIIDFAMYWLHRSQHVFKPLWELHAIHHSQQHMTFWSDAREHILSYVYYALMLAALSLLIGSGREMSFLFAGYVVRFIQSLSHANVRLSFGDVFGKIIVSPQFHRVHHAIGIGHEGKNSGCNFASVFAFWDVLFGTANTRNIYPRTGVRDQLTGRNYGETIFSQQWLALKRLARKA